MKDASQRGMAAAKKDGMPRQARSGGRALDVWAVPREKPDMDRFVAVLVTLALRRVEKEQAAKQAGPEGSGSKRS